PWTTIRYRISNAALANTNQSSAAVAIDPTKQVNTLTTLYPGTLTSIYPVPTPSQTADTPVPVRFTNVDQLLCKAVSTEEIPTAIRQMTELLHERHRINP